MSQSVLQLLNMYERSIVDRACELAESDNVAEAKAGIRMLACLACNRAALDQSCRACAFGTDAPQISSPRYETAEQFELA